MLRDKESQALLTMPVQYSLPKSAVLLSAHILKHAHLWYTGVPSWSVSDVGTFLDYIEIPEYKERFASRGINGAELLRLHDSALMNLGIDKLGHRKVRTRTEHTYTLSTINSFSRRYRRYSGARARCSRAPTRTWSHPT